MVKGLLFVDMKGLAERVKAHGAVNVGLMDGQSFAENMKKLTNSVDNIPNEIIIHCLLSVSVKYSVESSVESRGVRYIDKPYRLSIYRHFLKISILISISI